MSNSTLKRLTTLRGQMAKQNINYYLMTNSDYHGSEYIGEHFQAIRHLTGFSGSNATAVITQTQAYLWTDGRYFLQAEKQLEGSSVTLMRIGEDDVPTVKEFIKKTIKKGETLAYDGRTINAADGEDYRSILKQAGAILDPKQDLLDQFWADRPPAAANPFFILDETYSGKSVKEKIAEIRKEMKSAGVDTHILSSLTDIAWTLNIRGDDIAHVPVVMSYLIISLETCIWFLQEDVITQEQRAYLKENQIETRPYEAVEAYTDSLSGVSVLYDPETLNDRIVSGLSASVQRLTQPNPSELLKAVKNPVEIRNTVWAHIKDGVAFTKFMYWLKIKIGLEPVTELSAGEYLEDRRREQPSYLGPSFATICAYRGNAAMMHYQAAPDENAVLEPEGFLLVDSGGHYLEGTTDVTRTIALGKITHQMRQHFTAVLRANLALADAKFLEGCTGQNLDILAREPLWELGLDYKCGTGHGVGHILNVHEGPNAFRWKKRQGKDEDFALKAGMITTDEPGVYLAGEYGIRIENELLCKKAQKNEYGQFLCFETITYAPVDLDAVDAESLTEKEKMLLNQYHETVYKTLSPYLTAEETHWLKEYTRKI
ncbi:MAG: aminopeptidase P family protein [Eubacterium sp.]|nr:aminopeptidase P family protein [Eubacterium sp.]